MSHQIVEAFRGKHENNKKKIKGWVVLMKKNVLDLNDFNASLQDDCQDLLGNKVSMQLVSALHEEGEKGKVGSPAYLENWITATKSASVAAGESQLSISFDSEAEIGVPGALLVKNHHHNEFYLKTVTLELDQDDDHGGRLIHFVCNSWVYPADKYGNKDRIFFTNQTYLPSETPAPLLAYREEELVNLRGGDGDGTDDHHEELKEWDRIYDYALYNDLAEPDKGPDYIRPILGGSHEYPYPRRVRTGRKSTKTDPNSESRLPMVMGLNMYVPRDERFGHLKMSDFVAYGLKVISQFLIPELETLFDSSSSASSVRLDSFEDFLKLYEGGIKLSAASGSLPRNMVDNLEFIKELIRSDGEGFLKFPPPMLIKEDKTAWRTDEEFAREMVAGMNPIIIRGLKEFPPRSKLSSKIYGNQTSTITKDKIEPLLDGVSVEEAIKTSRVYIYDHHDTVMPYLRRINGTKTKAYATRTLLFLQKDGTLKPIAIELSLPHPDGDQFGAVSKVYTPAQHGVEASLWQLAKAYVAVNDSAIHQLISHWLQTHAVIEPFVIATNRQLSVVHPIYKLLHPHFRDTLSINAVARQTVLNAGGIFESTYFPSKYSMEFTSFMYKNWVFPDQALPADLIKRGLAVEDPDSPHGLRLLIPDYPFAVDGLEIWSAIKSWVEEYCNFYYKTEEMIQKDTELQEWWKEVREKGHADKKDEAWWPKMQTRKDLIDSCTIVIWISSALHAAINFAMYSYGGYIPHRPTVSQRFIPEEGSPEYEELKHNPDSVFFKTINSQLQTLLGMSLMETFSRHSSDEVYLGNRDTPQWTKDAEPMESFEKFGRKLGEIEKGILSKNSDPKLRNRNGPVKIPYTLFLPTSGPGLTGKGIPNSISI